MTPTDDTASPAWIWHGLAVDVVADTLATKWAIGSQAAARWLSTQPGVGVAEVIAWTRVMREVVNMAEDRTKPTADEIRGVVRFAQRKGW